MTNQLELLPKREHEELFPYWRDQLRQWIKDSWHYRHARNTTGWSMACQGLLFARLLFGAGQMDKGEFRRWWKFSRRIARWDGIDIVPKS